MEAGVRNSGRAERLKGSLLTMPYIAVSSRAKEVPQFQLPVLHVAVDPIVAGLCSQRECGPSLQPLGWLVRSQTGESSFWDEGSLTDLCLVSSHRRATNRGRVVVPPIAGSELGHAVLRFRLIAGGVVAGPESFRCVRPRWRTRPALQVHRQVPFQNNDSLEVIECRHNLEDLEWLHRVFDFAAQGWHLKQLSSSPWYILRSFRRAYQLLLTW